MDQIDLPKEIFDWIVLGTDLTESIMTAALGRQKKSILVLDSASGYSGLT
jgi:RAB protein geranylgeranyltransferase component A